MTEPRLIQFLHPGGEYERSYDHAGWSTEHDRHSRKFMVGPGKSLDDGREVAEQLVFWGEWEAQADRVAAYAPLEAGLPRRLWRPYLSIESASSDRLNTDPLVFGGFRYTICQQLRWYQHGPRPTVLRDLGRGSVILFGSKLLGEFVLDTVFVVASSELHNARTYTQLAVPGWYRDLTLDTLYRGAANGAEEYRLYTGATVEAPIEGMFSFVPSQTLAEGGKSGFRRPAIRHPLINPAQGQSFRAPVVGNQKVLKEVWESVLDQVKRAGLMPATALDPPPRRAAVALDKPPLWSGNTR